MQNKYDRDEEVHVNLKSGEEISVGDQIIQKSIVTGELIPAAYASDRTIRTHSTRVQESVGSHQ